MINPARAQHQIPDALSATFAALSDPTRRALLARLASGEASVNELAEPFPMSLPAVSKHLKVLENAGLIKKARSARWRHCQLEGAPLKDAMDWIGQYRQFWEQSFDRLDAYLQTLQDTPQDTPQEPSQKPSQEPTQTPSATKAPHGNKA